MKLLRLLPFLLFASCAYDGPMITVSAGFNGISAGVTLGGGTPAAKSIVLPPPSGK